MTAPQSETSNRRRYEIPAGLGVIRASQSEVREPDGDRLETSAPAARCKDLSADRGLDGGPVEAKLRERYGPLHTAPLRESRNRACPWLRRGELPGGGPLGGYPVRTAAVRKTPPSASRTAWSRATDGQPFLCKP